jgi:hypothetical protein
MELYVKDWQKSSIEAIKTKLCREQVLPSEAVNDLAEGCLLMKRKFFWLGKSRRHASRLAACCKKQN